MAVSPEPTATLDGRPFEADVAVTRLLSSKEDGWGVALAHGPDGTVTLVGPVGHLDARERVHVRGSWRSHARFGAQVSVRSAVSAGPADDAALRGYLTRVRHIGPARAARLIDRYGAGAVLEAIDRDPRDAFARVGLAPARAGAAVQSWDALRATRQLHLLLAPEGLGYLVARIQAHYGDRAHRIVRERPYELTSLFGVGFAIADRIARAASVAPDDPARARAAVLHVLGEAELRGSTCLPVAAVRAGAHELLGAEPVTEALLAGMCDDGHLERYEPGGGPPFLYRRAIAELEGRLAERVARLAAARPVARVSAALRRDVEPTLAPLAPEQRTAAQDAFRTRISIITGGPGTGKTTTIESIVAIAEAGKLHVELVAPTGRAAVRITQATGAPARTVHSALGWIPGTGPTHDDDAPLECDLLILDEASMANLELMAALLAAVGPATHVVLVGDGDQLAPVGAGKPFAELATAPDIAVTALQRIFRQAAGSMIVQAAHAVRAGRAPDFRRHDGMRHDLFFIDGEDPGAAADEITALVGERLPRHFGIDPVEDLQVFSPVYRGPLGIDALNARLQHALNPDGAAVPGRSIRVGDKLMLTGRSLHALGLMNGTILRLLDQRSGDGEDGPVLTLSGEGQLFTLSGDALAHLALAYACSIHKGQGIELPVAIVVAHPGAGAHFLRREMLYTAITRAKLATVVIGSQQTVARAAGRPDTEHRHSHLTRRLAAL